MINPHGTLKSHAHNKFLASMSAVFFLCVVLAASAGAQTTTTTLFAGTQDPSAFGLADVTLPGPGIVLPGTAINPATGLPVRHLWYGDNTQGLCRLDPDVDSAGTSPGPGLGSHTTNFATCVGGLTAPSFSAGEMAFDPATNALYVTDRSVHTNLGLVRMNYLPSGDNGQGSIDPASIQILVGPATNVPTCPPPNDPTLGGNSVGTQADAVALGPDGAIYFGYLHGGQVVKVTNPATLNPAANGACQANVSVPIVGPDEANKTPGNNFGMTWVGHRLFAGDNLTSWQQINADACVAGNNLCGPANTTNPPLHILGNVVGPVQGGVTGDGNNIYFATLGSITQVTNVAAGANLGVNTNYGGPFCFISGIAADAADPQQALYVGVDCAQGNIPDGGAIYKITPATGPVTDLSVTMSGPGSVNQNSSITYTIVVTNRGNQDVPEALLTDNVPGNVTGITFTTSKGVCALGNNLMCNLGDLAPGGSATVTLTMTAGTTSVTNSATVADFDAAGNPITDTNPANNTASFTTTVINPPPVQTDIQVTGSAQNGGPNAGTIDTYTWQIKNNQGTVTAPNVVFTNVLPSNLQFATASSTIGSCSTPADGAAGGTVTCSASSLPGGQTMVVTVNVVVTQAATIATTGSVTFQGTDTNPNNNSFTVTIKSK